jgi:phosphoglycerate kinase
MGLLEQVGESDRTHGEKVEVISLIRPVTDLKRSDLEGKIVYLRGSADAPMDEDKDLYSPARIKDTSRIDSFIMTLEYLVRNGARVVLQPGWIDRPDGVDPEKSTIPVYLYIKRRLRKSGLLRHDILFAPSELHREFRSIAKNFGMIQERVSQLKDGQVLVLENPRFDPEYNKGSEGYAQRLAGMVDIYVADDFAQRHRPAADIVPMPRHLPRFAGFHLLDEIEYARKISLELEKEKRKPFVLILAGKKIETKPGVVSKITVALNMLGRMRKTDKILVGGAVAFTFMLADANLDKVKAGPDQIKKISSRDIKKAIGDSYVAWGQIHEQIMLAGRVILKAREKGIALILPKDHTIVRNRKVVKSRENIPPGWAGADIGEKTIKEFVQAIENAGFVLMSGPVGMFDKNIKGAGTGSKALAHALHDAKKRGVTTMSAGGEATLLVNKTGVKISHASIGGGATLEFIEKGNLPGIEALES